jgi:penicillin amidase
VPGTGGYEWQGFRDDLPRELNPDRGWIATANHDIHPEGFEPPLFFSRQSTSARFSRLAEVLSGGPGFTVEDSERLQHDAFSASAAADLDRFRNWVASDPELDRYRQELADWDGVYRRESRAAAIYNYARRGGGGRGGRGRAGGGGQSESAAAGPEAALAAAIERLRETQGDDPAAWRWGRINRSEFPHELVSAYDQPSAERTGGGGTVAAIGATFREIIDFADLDASRATNAPGQSARPGSPFYGNLIESLSTEEYFPLSFSRAAVEANAAYRLVLQPAR